MYQLARVFQLACVTGVANAAPATGNMCGGEEGGLIIRKILREGLRNNAGVRARPKNGDSAIILIE